MPKPKTKNQKPKKAKEEEKELKTMTISDDEMTKISAQYELDFDNMAVLHEEFEVM